MSQPRESAAGESWTESPRASVEAIGTTVSGLIEPCSAPELEPRPPAPVPESYALSFSGGGWRAALAAAGVLRFLAGADHLDRVRWVSSVSGGSVTAAIFADRYEQVQARGFALEAVDELVVAPLLKVAREQSLQRKLIANSWRALGRKSRTDVLADAFDEWLYAGRQLESLSPDCRFVFNAANAATGVRFEFSADRVGDYVIGYASTRGTGLRLADAVAASAAVPGPFTAMRLRGLRFPCGDGADTRLLDGGVYDNLGLEAIDDLFGPCLIVLSAGGLLRSGALGLLQRMPLIGALKRSQELLYRQTTALRSRTIVERFRVWEKADPPPPGFARRGVLFGLATTIDKVPEEWARGRPVDDGARLALAKFKTTFARVPAEVCEGLIYRSWWLTGASLARFHPGLVEELPHWQPLPAADRR